MVLKWIPVELHKSCSMYPIYDRLKQHAGFYLAGHCVLNKKFE